MALGLLAPALLPPGPALPRARAAAGVEVHRDLSYHGGPGAHPLHHRLDLYLPAGRRDYPLLVFAHGGGWTGGDRRNHAALGQGLAERGIGVALVNYRLSDGKAGSVMHPEHARDLARALAFTRAFLLAEGVSPIDLFLMGQGAGAHLAALVGLHPRFLAEHGLETADLRGVIGLSGTYQVDPTGRAYANVFGIDPAMRLDASPIHQVSQGEPPFLLVTAELDLPRRAEEASLLADALRRAGGAVQRRVVAGRDFDTLVERIGQPGDPTTALVETFVRQFQEPRSAVVPSPSPAPAASPTPAPVAPPGQAAEGPGGAARPHGAVKDVVLGTGPAARLLRLPEEPAPAGRLPILVFFAAEGAEDPALYGAWLDHIARGGMALVFPTGLQAGGPPGPSRLARASAMLRAVLADAEAPGGPPLDPAALVLVGHGEGAALAAALAADWFALRLPAPRAILALMPRDAGGLLESAPLARLPADTQLLIVAAAGDAPGDEAGEQRLWDGTAQLLRARRNRLLVPGDAYGSPDLPADHRLPFTAGFHGRVDGLDWHGSWKWLDALSACALGGLDCAYAFGGGPGQLGLGRWADGRPVAPALLTEGPPRPVRWLRFLPLGLRRAALGGR